METGFNWLRRGSSNGYCKHGNGNGNEPMASTEVGNSEWPAEKLLDSQKPSSCELIGKCSARWLLLPQVLAASGQHLPMQQTIKEHLYV